MKRFTTIALTLAVAIVTSAHIGSPNVLFDGTAGAYPVRVIVRPPEVVPGLAEVIVRVDAADAQRVLIRPVFWRTGVAGAPAGDEMRRVAGRDRVYTGQLWLMAYGAYSVYVTVSGARGSGTAIVPVSSFATGRLPLSGSLGGILVVLAGLLVAGLLTIVRAAAGESLVPPGEAFDASKRRRANSVAAMSAAVLALAIFGGAKWWRAEDAGYRRNMYGSPAAIPTVNVDATHRTLHLAVHDTAKFQALYSPVAPDHGKMMHLFLVRLPNMDAFAHLHPVQSDSLIFDGEVPALPAGRYRLFGDLALENGLSLTVTNTVELPDAPGVIAPSDSDDAWTLTPSVTRAAAGAETALGDGFTLAWNGDAGPLVAGRATDLRFVVRDAKGEVARLRPYLGMAAHAVVVRGDGSVFIHLHPMGTVAMVSQQVFALRDRGDTTPRGRIRQDALAADPMPAMSMSGALAFPYEFPKPGRYRVWVQVKPDRRVLTGTFDVDVH
jgi:hypothetical protein